MQLIQPRKNIFMLRTVMDWKQENSPHERVFLTFSVTYYYYTQIDYFTQVLGLEFHILQVLLNSLSGTLLAIQVRPSVIKQFPRNQYPHYLINPIPNSDRSSRYNGPSQFANYVGNTTDNVNLHIADNCRGWPRNAEDRRDVRVIRIQT